MGFSLYLIWTRDIDLIFKMMLRCLLADGLQLNQKVGRWGVRKRWQEWKPRPGVRAGGGWEGQRKWVDYRCCAGLPLPEQRASELQRKLSGVFFLVRGRNALPTSVTLPYCSRDHWLRGRGTFC